MSCGAASTFVAYFIFGCAPATYIHLELGCFCVCVFLFPCFLDSIQVLFVVFFGVLMIIFSTLFVFFFSVAQPSCKFKAAVFSFFENLVTRVQCCNYTVTMASVPLWISVLLCASLFMQIQADLLLDSNAYIIFENSNVVVSADANQVLLVHGTLNTTSGLVNGISVATLQQLAQTSQMQLALALKDLHQKIAANQLTQVSVVVTTTATFALLSALDLLSLFQSILWCIVLVCISRKKQ